MYLLPKDDSFPCYEGVGRASRGVAPELDEFGQRRVTLIETLRDRAKWPEGFKWEFHYYGSCAMGLLALLTGRRTTDSKDAAELLGISPEDAMRMFVFGCSTYGVLTHDQVTPEMVANRLEQVHRSILHPTVGRASP